MPHRAKGEHAAGLEIAHTGLQAAMKQAWLWLGSYVIENLKSSQWPGLARAGRGHRSVSVSMGKHGGYRGLCMHRGSFLQGTCTAPAARVKQMLRGFLSCIAFLGMHQEGSCLRDRVLVIEKNIYTILQSPTALNTELHVM